MHIDSLQSFYSSMLLAFNRAGRTIESAALRASAGNIESLPDVMVELSVARAQQRAALVAIQTAQQMDDSILDIIA